MIRSSTALFIAATSAATSLATSLATTGTALAQDAEPEVTSSDPVPGDPNEPLEGPPRPAGEGDGEGGEGEGSAGAGGPGIPLTLGKGKILLAGSTVNVSLSADLVGKPASIAPSVWYGVSDQLTVGLTHDLGTTPWTPRVVSGAGICFTGEENGCGEVYDNVGVDALYTLVQGKLSLAAHPALDARSFDPFRLSLRIGVLGSYAINEQIAIVFDPRIAIGLTERDADALGNGGNEEVLDLPVWAWFAATPELGVYVHTGIAGPLDGFGDAFTIPVQVGGSYKINPSLTAGLDLRFANLLGNGNTGDLRELGFRAAFAL